MENKFKKFLEWFFHSYIWVGVILLIVDIISKNLICNLMVEGESIVLIPNFLNITYTVNRHAAFGIGSDNLLLNKIVYIVIACAATAYIIYYFIKNEKRLKGYFKAALFLIAAGAVGNMIDRIFYSAEYLHAMNDYPGVVDFIDFFNGSALYELWHYIFNVADCGVVIGVFMLVIGIIVEEVKEYKANKTPKDDTKVLSKSEKEKIEQDNKDTIK